MRGYAAPKVYRSFEEFERDELRKLDGLHSASTTCSTRCSPMSSTSKRRGGEGAAFRECHDDE